ncbi:hypothetical protein BB558_003571, partial [Smittium angustum]
MISFSFPPTQIAQCVLTKYQNLSKAGKPTRKNEKKTEWTVLAGIVLESQNGIECVALGTGTKCLSEKELCGFGDLVSDSHAEIITKRAFTIYLLDQINLYLSENNSSSIFKGDSHSPNSKTLHDQQVRCISEHSNKLKLGNVKFHMYISQCPCGSASTKLLLEKLESNKTKQPINLSFEVMVDSHKHTLESESNLDLQFKRTKVDIDVQDTTDSNNKADINGDIDDKLLRGRSDFSKEFSLRTKPGRIDADSTLSMSCSDKITMWNVTGIQSAILSLLVEPIYLSSIIISKPCIDIDVVISINDRISKITDLPYPHILNKPQIVSIPLEFESSQESILKKLKETTLVPCEASINWFLESSKDNKNQKAYQEVTVKGKKQGSSKRKLKQVLDQKSRSRLCKFEVYKKFTDVWKEYHKAFNTSDKNDEDQECSVCKNFQNESYEGVKKLSKNYQESKEV